MIIQYLQNQVSITYGLINVNTKVEEVPLGIYNYISDNITVYNNKNYLEVQKMNGENGLLSMTDFTYLPATIVNNDTEAKVRKLTK